MEGKPSESRPLRQPLGTREGEVRGPASSGRDKVLFRGGSMCAYSSRGEQAASERDVVVVVGRRSEKGITGERQEENDGEGMG